jgi:hypothetical protein
MSSPGDQDLNRPSHEFSAGIAEQLLCLSIHQEDRTILSDHYDGVGSSFEEGTVEPFIRGERLRGDLR